MVGGEVLTSFVIAAMRTESATDALRSLRLSSTVRTNLPTQHTRTWHMHTARAHAYTDACTGRRACTATYRLRDGDPYGVHRRRAGRLGGPSRSGERASVRSGRQPRRAAPKSLLLQVRMLRLLVDRVTLWLRTIPPRGRPCPKSMRLRLCLPHGLRQRQPPARPPCASWPARRHLLQPTV
jgi:hypothetical protein